MSIHRAPEAVLEPLATPELFALVSTLIRKRGRAALATRGEDGDVCGAIVRVAQTADGAPVFTLSRHDEQVQRLSRDARVGLLVADAGIVRVTLVGTAAKAPEEHASTIAFRLQIERIRFASPERSAWYRVAIHPRHVH